MLVLVNYSIAQLCFKSVKKKKKKKTVDMIKPHVTSKWCELTYVSQWVSSDVISGLM